ERLAAALGVPDDSTRATAFRIRMRNTVHRAFHAEVLLIASNLLLTTVVEDEAMHQLHESLRTTERVENPVLLCDLSPGCFERLEVASHVPESLAEQFLLLICRESL